MGLGGYRPLRGHLVRPVVPHLATQEMEVNLREAAQQAIKVMANARDFLGEGHYKNPTKEWNPEQQADELQEALFSLRAALAEPVEPVAWVEPKWLDPDTRGWPSDSFASQPIEGWLPLYTAPAPQPKPQTTHWEGCEAVHPECKTEHGVKDLSNYEFKTYKTGGAELEAGFYSTDELRDLVKALDKMNAVAERSMRRMKRAHGITGGSDGS